MCNGELDAFARCSAVLDELGRHPHAGDDEHGHEHADEDLKRVGDVGVATGWVGCDAEGADVHAVGIISVSAVADLVPLVGRVNDRALK